MTAARRYHDILLGGGLESGREKEANTMQTPATAPRSVQMGQRQTGQDGGMKKYNAIRNGTTGRMKKRDPRATIQGTRKRLIAGVCPGFVAMLNVANKNAKAMPTIQPPNTDTPTPSNCLRTRFAI